MLLKVEIFFIKENLFFTLYIAVELVTLCGVRGKLNFSHSISGILALSNPSFYTTTKLAAKGSSFLKPRDLSPFTIDNNTNVLLQTFISLSSIIEQCNGTRRIVP